MDGGLRVFVPRAQRPTSCPGQQCAYGPACPRAIRVGRTAVRCVGRVWHDEFMDGLTRLTDGVVVLRPLDLEDVAEHLVGEDEELVRWLNGGPGTRETVKAHVRACMAAWEAGGPTITFGICAELPERLMGTVDAHLELPGLEPGQANIAYGLYPRARGRGLALRAVTLICAYLAARHGVREAIIRTEPTNAASVAVALRAGFRLAPRGGAGELDWYVRDLARGSAPIALHSAGHGDEDLGHDGHDVAR